jgi:glycosyltransferase involved in cell wall biosynthesis
MEDPTSQHRVAFISSFAPRRCGIATFAGDLIENLRPTADPGYQPFVVAMESDSGRRYQPPVEFAIRRDVPHDYAEARAYINFRTPEVVSLQHEFGLFGGEGGSYVHLLLEGLNAPLVTTLHTVLHNPSSSQRNSLRRVCARSDVVVVMNARGLDMLTDTYQVPARKIRLIPHGIPDLPPDSNGTARQRLGLAGRKVILTFGLLSKNKGVEVMLRAMPAITKAHPDVLYVVLGSTHPEVVKHEGYRYLNQLHRIVHELGLHEHVLFHSEFVSDEVLKTFLQAAHIYVTPYLQEEQLTSGTLAFAVGTGKAVISTPYWAAEELLAQGRGRLVPFGDSKRIAAEVIRLLSNGKYLKTLQDRAYAYGRSITWPKVASTYRGLFLELSHQPRTYRHDSAPNEPVLRIDHAGPRPMATPAATAVLQGVGH